MKQPLRATTDSMIGSVLLGRYRVVRELAKGGMGVVYLARSEGAVGFVKPVVIKLLLPEHAQDDRFVGMFVREAQILSQLRHPSLVDVLEFGEQEGAYVLVMEYVRGYHLGQWLRYLAMKKREAPADILIQIVIDVLEALHHAHKLMHPDGSSMQIVHRDVSPSNILLDEDGRGRLLDFGVARMRGGAHDYKTQVKGFMGKLPYTAPELFANTEASPRSDLYACAVVLHEALHGSNVFRTEMQAATLHKVMTHVPEPVEHARPGVPAGLDAVLAKALTKSRDERFTDAREFSTALRKLQGEQESDIRAHLAALLKADFGADMAEMLNLESLAHRDAAWRRLSHTPPRPPRGFDQGAGGGTAPGLMPPQPFPAAPAESGATVAVGGRGQGRSRVVIDVDSDEDDSDDETNRPPAPIDVVTRGLPVGQETGREVTTRSKLARRGSAGVDPDDLPSSRPANTQTAAAPNNRGIMIALALVGALAIGAIVLVLVMARPPPGPSPNQQPIRVVSLPNDPVAQPQPTPDPPPTAAVKPVEPAAVEPTRRPLRPKATGPDPQGLTAAFRKQQGKLEACFRDHSVTLEGQPTTQLEFDIDAAGKLIHVDLAPRALASTELGACLLKIARGTTFPAQGSPVSFAIPVTARRAATGG